MPGPRSSKWGDEIVLDSLEMTFLYKVLPHAQSWEIVGTNRSTSSLLPLAIAPMDQAMNTEQSSSRIPRIQFRVLIIGRANAGKTSILQRVCDTTESPLIYRGNEEVRSPTFLFVSLISPPNR